MSIPKKPISKENLYKFHTENLREIDSAIKHLHSSVREAIGKKDFAAINSFIKIYGFLLGAWAECRLQKLLYEPKAFENDERKQIKNKRSQLDKWLATVEIGFRKHYNIPKAELNIQTLKHTTFSRYETLVILLKTDLRITIELRNKLAHAQWAYPLNEDGDGLALEALNLIKSENLLSLKLKKQLLEQIAETVNDLVVSKPTFERDFDKHFMRIDNAKNQLQKRDYAEYAKNIRLMKKRGNQKKLDNIN